MVDKTIAAVIPAGGVGSRFKGERKKQFHLLNGKPILYHTVHSLLKSYQFNELVIGAASEDHSEIKVLLGELLDRYEIDDFKLSISGAERANTVLNAINSAESEYVLIHDAVRPFVNAKVISETVNKACITGGAICGVFPRDTIKSVKDGVVESTIDRGTIFMAHTPQVFQRKRLISALATALKDGRTLTDDASAYEYAGEKVSIVLSTMDNIKITEQDDLSIVNNLIDKYL